MATTGDPWRTLGLTPGASLDEVRRAYRRLAKANHPDAAGEAALPRFLAIQAAYEAIAGPARGRRIAGRPAAAARPTPPAEPWRADPDRARASGRADGRRPGARPSGRPASGPGGAPPDGGTAPGSGTAGGDRARTSSTGRARRSSSRRGPKSAGPYSTSYDAVDEEPFEPGWSGATWYGASSGTYWTINPKEYADPRKHGPEYQARARRSRRGWVLDDAGPAGPDAPEAAPDAAGPVDDGDPSTADPARARRGGLGHRPSAWSAAREAAAPGEAGPPPPPPLGGSSSPAAAVPEGFHPFLLPEARSVGGRLGTALLGAFPLALFTVSAIDQSTGCGRYAASCGEASSPGTWIVAAAILVLLIAVPIAARWSAHGTVAMVVVGIPVAVVLSAAGGTNVRDASAPILMGTLALAYLAGVVYGVVAPRLAVAPASRDGRTGSLR